MNEKRKAMKKIKILIKNVIRDKRNSKYDFEIKWNSNKIYLNILLLLLCIKIINYVKRKEKINNLKVCLCAIGKKENLYAKEYVNHYKNLGYKHIYIYDNNDINDEKFEDVLQEEIKENFVTIIDFRGKPTAQCVAYIDCYEKYNKQYDWLSFLILMNF